MGIEMGQIVLLFLMLISTTGIFAVIFKIIKKLLKNKH